jgi:hypothetical protein
MPGPISTAAAAITNKPPMTHKIFFTRIYPYSTGF